MAEACGETVVPADSTESLPGGGTLTSYYVNGVLETEPVPPDGFNPLTATDAQLDEYGFAPRPDQDSTDYQDWLDDASSQVAPADPYVIETFIAADDPGNWPSCDDTQTQSECLSANWSGYVGTKSGGYTAAMMRWIEPAPTHTDGDAGECTTAQEAMSVWTGLGGNVGSITRPTVSSPGRVTVLGQDGTFPQYEGRPRFQYRFFYEVYDGLAEAHPHKDDPKWWAQTVKDFPQASSDDRVGAETYYETSLPKSHQPGFRFILHDHTKDTNGVSKTVDVDLGKDVYSGQPYQQTDDRKFADYILENENPPICLGDFGTLEVKRAGAELNYSSTPIDLYQSGASGRTVLDLVDELRGAGRNCITAGYCTNAVSEADGSPAQRPQDETSDIDPGGGDEFTITWKTAE